MLKHFKKNIFRLVYRKKNGKRFQRNELSQKNFCENEQNIYLFFNTGSNGLIFRTRVTNCNTIRCPAWSDWFATSECSGTCKGVRNESSTCRYNGALSDLCEGKENSILEKLRKLQICLKLAGLNTLFIDNDIFKMALPSFLVNEDQCCQVATIKNFRSGQKNPKKVCFPRKNLRLGDVQTT